MFGRLVFIVGGYDGVVFEPLPFESELPFFVDIDFGRAVGSILDTGLKSVVEIYGFLPSWEIDASEFVGWIVRDVSKVVGTGDGSDSVRWYVDLSTC